jgi:cytochrome c biogenesis protein
MPKPKSVEKDKGNPFWDFFSSVRLTIGLLILLAVASIAGTLIPQREEAARVAHEMSPALVQLFDTLQLFDVYHSFWFRIIIAALGLNLVICSIDRFPITWKRFRSHAGLDRTSIFKDIPSDQIFSVPATKKEAAGYISEWLRRRYRKVDTRSTNQEEVFYSDKGRTSYFGVYLVHLSVLLILIGGIVGSFIGFEAHVNIPEGTAADTVFLRRGGHPVNLGFSVYCRSFKVEFYENGTPKEYKSELAFQENGRVVQESPILVNHPVTFRGITFYQSSYGTLAGDKILLRIIKEGSGKEESVVEARKGETFQLPDQDGTAVVSEVRADLMRLGPAAQIQIKPKSGEPVLFWVFLNHDLIQKKVPGLFEKSPRFNYRAYEPYSFFMVNAETKYYTGLQVNRDPGVPLVWAGCIMMVFGFFVTFFASHQRIWVRISQKNGKTNVSVVGRSNKNPAAVEREIQRITEGLRSLSR